MTASEQGTEGLTSFLKRTGVVEFGRKRLIELAPERQFTYLVSGVAIVHYGRKNADLLLPGDFYGEEGFFAPKYPPAAVETLTPCEVMTWPVTHVDTVLGSDNGFMWAVARLMHARTERFRGLLEISTWTVPERLAWHLRDIVKRLESVGLIEAAEQGVYWMPKWLTHDKIALLVGTSRELTTENIGRQRKREEQRRWAVCPEDLKKFLKGALSVAANPDSL